MQRTMSAARAIRRVKQIAQFSSAPFAAVVASMGRSGSTLVFNAVAKAMARRYARVSYPDHYKVLREETWTLEGTRFRKGLVYKTHDYPGPFTMNVPLRAIYLYASPYDVVRSVLACRERYGEAWAAEHFAHLKADFALFDRILEQDALRLEEHFAAWVRPQAFPLIAIRYDALWESEEMLGDFLGAPIALPARRERTTAQDMAETASSEAFLKTYEALDRRISAMPAVNVFP